MVLGSVWGIKYVCEWMKPPPTQHDSMHLHEIIQVCMKLVSKDTCEAKEIPHVPDLFENLVFVRWEVLRREKKYHQENIESSHYPESTFRIVSSGE